MKSVFLIIHLFFFSLLSGQNFVPNGGFEGYSVYPVGQNQINLSYFWTNVNGNYFPSMAGGSPDFFHTGGSGPVQLPNTIFAFVNANTGNACAGFSTYNDSIPDSREYISGLMNADMVPGQTYNISFFLSTGIDPVSEFRTGNIGILFSTYALYQNSDEVINAVPQVEVVAVVDTPGFKNYFFQFVADSAYKYISVGNFRPDAGTNRIQLQGSAAMAYYFIDDISVNLINNTLPDVEIPNVFTPNGDGMNDDFKITGQGISKMNCIIYSAWGQKVYEYSDISGHWNGLVMSGKKASGGVYFYVVNVENFSGSERSYRGFVHLIR